MGRALPLIKRTKERTVWRIGASGLEPMDRFAGDALRHKGFKRGDVVAVEMFKARSPGFHRLAHQLGGMLAENVEAFAGMGAHAVLKRLQIEAGIGCDVIALNFPGVGPCLYRVPRSLSFESMDEAEFRDVIAGMCRHVSRQYWPTCTPEEIERMASVWVEAT